MKRKAEDNTEKAVLSDDIVGVLSFCYLWTDEVIEKENIKSFIGLFIKYN